MPADQRSQQVWYRMKYRFVTNANDPADTNNVYDYEIEQGVTPTGSMPTSPNGTHPALKYDLYDGSGAFYALMGPDGGNRALNPVDYISDPNKQQNARTFRMWRSGTFNADQAQRDVQYFRSGLGNNSVIDPSTNGHIITAFIGRNYYSLYSANSNWENAAALLMLRMQNDFRSCYFLEIKIRTKIGTTPARTTAMLYKGDILAGGGNATLLATAENPNSDIYWKSAGPSGNETGVTYSRWGLQAEAQPGGGVGLRILVASQDPATGLLTRWNDVSGGGVVDTSTPYTTGALGFGLRVDSPGISTDASPGDDDQALYKLLISQVEVYTYTVTV